MKNLGDFVTFEKENHKYFTEDKTELISVSRFLKLFFEEFDEDGSILVNCAAKRGVEPQELKAEWNKKRDDSCMLGTAVHSEFEYYFKNGKIRNSEYKHVVKDFDRNFKLDGEIHSEVIVANKELGLAGCVDILQIKDGIYNINDIKTNRKLSSYSFGKYMLPPISHIFNSTYEKYVLQLSCYAYLLDSLGYWIGNDLNIFWVNFAKNRVEKIPVEYRRKDVERMLDARD